MYRVSIVDLSYGLAYVLCSNFLMYYFTLLCCRLLFSHLLVRFFQCTSCLVMFTSYGLLLDMFVYTVYTGIFEKVSCRFFSAVYIDIYIFFKCKCTCIDISCFFQNVFSCYQMCMLAYSKLELCTFLTSPEWVVNIRANMCFFWLVAFPFE